MALAVSAYKRFRLGRMWELIATIRLSSTYTTGGDTLSFLLAGIPQSMSAAASPPLVVRAKGLAGYDYEYHPGTGRDDGKLMVRDGGGTQIAQDAYAQAILDDIITVEAKFAA